MYSVSKTVSCPKEPVIISVHPCLSLRGLVLGLCLTLSLPILRDPQSTPPIRRENRTDTESSVESGDLRGRKIGPVLTTQRTLCFTCNSFYNMMYFLIDNVVNNVKSEEVHHMLRVLFPSSSV